MKFLSKTVLALTAAALLAGCAETKNSESTGQFLDNSAVTAKVKTALLNDKVIHSLPITVKTYKGQVQLSGFVNTAKEKAKAGLIARDVPGVDSVKNDLVVR